MSDTFYTSERMTEIMKDFQKALMEADNFSNNDPSPDYRQFWRAWLTAIRLSELALTNYLLEEISVKKVGDDSEAYDLWQDEGGEG